ncbi:MAG: Crp/Fnr family transcriptional regulator [Cyanobacteria bacterium J06554_11]
MSYFLRYTDNENISAGSNVVTLKRRDLLPKEQLWEIQSGFVRVITWSDSGEVMPLGFGGAGSLVGGALAISSPCEIQVLTPAVARQLTPSFPIPKVAFIHQTRQTTELLKILYCRQVEERLLRFTCWLAHQYGQSTPEGICLCFQLTHQELADAIASTRVTVTRCLKQLEAEGYLKWSRAEKVVFHSALTLFVENTAQAS